MASMIITNQTANNVTLTGDAGVPRVIISTTATVSMSDVVGNVQFCTELAAYITAGDLVATIGGVTQSAARITAYKDGDMSASIYDTDGDGIVDSSNDGTTHAASDGSSHTFIDQDVTSGASPVFAVTNMTGSAAGLDSDATAHAASAGLDHSYIQDNLVQVVITAVGGSGGATAGTISVQVNDLAGTPITRAVNIRLDISDTSMAGSLDAAGTCQFGAATTGTLIVGTAAASAIVTTDGTGLYEGALSNANDETNYFSASSTDGGAATAANSCVVTQCAVASATWSA